MIEDDIHKEAIKQKFFNASDFFQESFTSLPEKFGKFKIIGLIGQGGAGDVYLALDTTLQRQVALKILTRLSTQDLERFYREARITAKLDHPNIIKIHEIGSVDNLHYISMQYIKGETLNQKELKINDALKIIRKVASILDYAHGLGIIHRDIKPSNIIVDEQSNIYLMDFGIAKHVVDKTSTISLTGSIIGTPAFMSPEQARGEVHKIDLRTDIYELGSTLYYLVTHTEPFRGSSTIEIINKVIDEDPPAPKKINDQTPRDVEAIIMKAMSKGKSSRYQSVSDFIHDIELYLAGEPVLAKRTSLATRFIKKIRRKKSAVFVALFVLISAFMGFYFLKKQIQQQESLNWINKGIHVMNGALKMSYNSESDPAKIREKLLEAIRIFQQAIDKYPLALAYYYKGRIYRELARYKEAQDALSIALNLDLKMDVARIERSYVRVQECLNEIYISGGDLPAEVHIYLEDALKDIQNIKEEDLESEEARQMRIFILAVQNAVAEKFDNAVDLLTRSEGWQENEDLLHLLGLVYCIKKDLDQSIDYQTRALKLRPHYDLAYLIRAWAYLKKRELMRALDDLDKAVYINPWLVSAYLLRSAIYLANERLDNALADSNKVIELLPDSERGHVNRGEVFRRKGDFDAAMKDFNKAIQIDPRSRKAYINRGNLFDDLKEYDKAIEDYNKAISIDSSYFLIYYNRGLTYFKISDRDRSLADFQRCIELNPRYPPAHLNMAAILVDKNDMQGALKCYNAALEIDKNYAEGYKARGVFYFNNGSFDLAEADLKKAIGIDPRLANELSPLLDQIKKRER